MGKRAVGPRVPKRMKLVRIKRDDYPQSPREWDNLGTMVCAHRRYCLGDEQAQNAELYYSWDEWLEYEVVKPNGGWSNIIALPLYLYDHGGITISTAPFACPWDSGQVGWIYVTKSRIREEYGVKRVSKRLLNKVEAVLRSEVETYDQYLQGNVYGYMTFSLENGELVDGDSCWGFFGNNVKENGLQWYLENVIPADILPSTVCGKEIILADNGKVQVFDDVQEFKEFAQNNSVLCRIMETHKCFQSITH
jgi:hypothetical protein